METQAALVRANGVVELDAVAAVDLHLALVVHPRDAEHDDAIRLHKTVQQTDFFIFGMFVKDGRKGLQHLGGRLQEFLLLRVAGLQAVKYALYICVHRENLLSVCSFADRSFVYSGYFMTGDLKNQ